MKIKYNFLLVLALMLPQQLVFADYVSPLMYSKYSCDELSEEHRFIKEKAWRMLEERKTTILSGVKNWKEQSKQLEQEHNSLLEHIHAIEEAMTRNGCGAVNL